jgi:hypothetical protein
VGKSDVKILTFYMCQIDFLASRQDAVNLDH